MKRKLSNRLRRLRTTKRTRDLKPVPKSRLAPAEKLTEQLQRSPVRGGLLQLLPSARIETNAEGGYLVVDSVYGQQTQHGDMKLGRLLTSPSPLLTKMLGLPTPLHSWQDVLFLDTETTGLGGAGTLAFMVGVGFFEGDAFVVRQFFLREPSDEAAMLADLGALVAGKRHLVTFNGRTFDVPLLQMRYLMNRKADPLNGVSNIDLLHPARRIWRRRLGSCALSALEPALLGVRRSGEDVPGWMIPQLYHDYLRSGDGAVGGDGGDLTRVFYHNRLDILSMVTLAARLSELLAQPEACAHGLDMFSLGLWQAKMGKRVSAEALFRKAAQADLALDAWHEVLLALGLLLKRADRRLEALPFWQQVAATSEGRVDAHIELAKFYEWHEIDLAAALRWTDDGLRVLGRVDQPQFEALAHRLARLKRKLAK